MQIPGICTIPNLFNNFCIGRNSRAIERLRNTVKVVMCAYVRGKLKFAENTTARMVRKLIHASAYSTPSRIVWL